MSASPELTRLPSELALRPIRTTRPAEDRRPAIFQSKDGEWDDTACRTPTSPESRLSLIPLTCPPAPRKLRPVLRCKRRLSELELFVVGADELESLFRQRAAPPLLQRVKKAKVYGSDEIKKTVPSV